MSAELGDSYSEVHARMTAAGLLPRPLAEDEARRLFPVLRWMDRRMTEVLGPEREVRRENR